MMIKPMLLSLLFVTIINSINGYSYKYGLMDAGRGDLAEEELLANLYENLENNNQEDEERYDRYGEEAREYEKIASPYYPEPLTTLEDEKTPEKLVDKTKISRTIEEDQELRRANSSKDRHDKSSHGSHLEAKDHETILHGASAKEMGTAKTGEKSLPFYCHPPNPCPKGMTASDGCLEFVENTAEYQKEWISQSQKKGLCQCDEDHMFQCQDGGNEDSFGGSNTVVSSELEKVLEEMAKENLQDNPFTKGGQKRQSLVAKKLPRFKRDVEHKNMEEELTKEKRSKKINPYLEGLHLHTVAKKG